MRSHPLQTVIQTCLQRAESAPLSERAELYLGLAEICGEPKQAVEFRKLARDLTTLGQRASQLHLGVIHNA